MLKRLARWVLREDLRLLHGGFRPGHIFYLLEKNEESFEKWTRIKNLTEDDSFRFILRYLYNEAEREEQEVGSSNAHRFWFYQGMKAVLSAMWDLNAKAKQKMYFFAGAKEKKEAQEAPASHSYQ